MRVCQIIEPASGGSIRVALDISKGLSRRADEVSFLYSPLRADQNFYQTIDTISGVKFCPFVIKNSVGLHDLYALCKLLWFLKRTGPYDVLHAHSSKAGGLARLAGVFFPRMALVYSPHAFVTMAPSASRVYGLIERWLSRATDAIIAVSGFEKRHGVTELGIDPNKIVVIPNAVPAFPKADRTQARALMGVGPEAFVFGFVGRLVEQKNVGRLVAAFKIAADQNPSLNLVVLGDGACRSTLDEALAQNGLQNKVKVVGNQDARSYYAGFDAVVCSSDYEGFSLVFLEALAAGVPIVTTPVGGAEETVIEGKTGFVAPDFLEESLALLMLKIAALSVADRETMRQAALEHSKKFTIEAVLSSVYAVYAECVQKRQR